MQGSYTGVPNQGKVFSFYFYFFFAVSLNCDLVTRGFLTLHSLGQDAQRNCSAERLFGTSQDALLLSTQPDWTVL